jgi:CDP-glucose 4,6-dehydratase
VAAVAVNAGGWAGRRVLVTGHTGFKGAWLSLWLAQLGAEVVGLSDEIPTEPSLFALAGVAGDLAADVRADVRDLDAVRAALDAHRPEVVVHLAAQPLVRASHADPVGTLATNVMGTAHVLEAVRLSAAPPRAVVVVTSDKCYENREWEWPYREDEPMGGKDPYSASKGAAELVVAAYRRTFFATPDLPRVATARAGNVLGGGDWGADRLVPDLVRAAAAGTPARIRNPTAIRPWQHVLNPLSGYLALAERLLEDPAAATAWNFGPADAEARSVGWVVERLVAAWDGEPAIETDPGPHPPEAGTLRVDSSRARTRLGWTPAWGLEEGLARTAAWYRAVGEDPGAARELTLAQLSEFAAPRR